MIIERVNLTLNKSQELEKVQLVEEFLVTDLGLQASECGNIVVHGNDSLCWVEINKVAANPMASDNQSIALKRLLLTLI
ncbi:MAG: hypothetical protein PHV62_05930 [Sulfuricurvum sp.]|nr:hypothetical protein [Sulfuricurvum sp.]